MLAAFRRIAVIVTSTAALTAVGGLLVGWLLGASVERSVSVGFYIVGCFFLISGFFVGNRGPARVKSESPGPSMLPIPGFGSSRRLRWATLEEQEETIGHSGLFIALGAILIVIGTLVDTQRSLV
jgi:hypothetical protein